MRALNYILYPPAFIRDMRQGRVSEFSFFLLLLVVTVCGYSVYAEGQVYLLEWVFAVAYCLLSYALYAYYKVRGISYLVLFTSISSIAGIWGFVAGYLLTLIQRLSDSGVYYDNAFLLFWLLHAGIYIILFHCICHDMGKAEHAKNV